MGRNKKIDNIKEYIDNLLKEKFNDSSLCFPFKFYLKDDNTRQYIEKYDYLLGLNDKRINKFLRTVIYIWGIDSDNDVKKYLSYDKSLLSETTKKFFDKITSAYIKFRDRYKNTEKIETERQILRPFNETDIKMFEEEFYNNLQDFNNFTLQNENKSQIKLLIKSYFKKVNNFILELKENKQIIGYVQLSVEGDFKANLGYYIFKKYRNKGFAKESCKAIIQKAFDGKIFIYKQTTDFNYKKKYVDLEFIEAKCLDDNETSKCVLKSLGFTQTGYKYKSENISNIYHTLNFYILKNPNYIDNKVFSKV